MNEMVNEREIPFRRRDPERKRKVLELFSAGLGATAIAQQVGGTEASVRKIRDAEQKKKVTAQAASQAGPGNPWYRSIADNNLEASSAAARNELPKSTTDLHESVTVREITEEELKLHTFPHTVSDRDTAEERDRKLKAGRKWMQARLTDPPRNNHQGFVIFPPPKDADHTCANEQLPSLLDQANYQKLLVSIFQSVQGPHGRSQTKAGDRKRKQAKMLDVAELAEKRCQEAGTAFKRFKHETISHAKAKAHQTLLETRADQKVVLDVIQDMCDNYERVREVSFIWLFFSYQYIQLNGHLTHLGLAISAQYAGPSWRRRSSRCFGIASWCWRTGISLRHRKDWIDWNNQLRAGSVHLCAFLCISCNAHPGRIAERSRGCDRAYSVAPRSRVRVPHCFF